jgi:hypothetical protein
MTAHPNLITVALLSHRGGDDFDCIAPSGLAVANLNGDTEDAVNALRRLQGTKLRPQITLPSEAVSKVG